MLVIINILMINIKQMIKGQTVNLMIDINNRNVLQLFPASISLFLFFLSHIALMFCPGSYNRNK